ncbi:hypothetical protein [Azorhizobium doebereinerae]|uniref:hypothetical protein n=1 Tax=Azorhizobium doebereinerae TaxID=281091 RepID=UPI00048E8D0C|nr:hypothetical protein [Azorhizobium doebereinerae]
MATDLLTIRSLHSIDDLIQAHALYLEHAGDFLPIPDPDDLHDAMKDGQIFGCSNRRGQLVAVGGTFFVARCRRGGGQPVSVYELAGLVVHPDARRLKPYGLQDVLVAVRAISLSLQQHTSVCLISSIATANNGSRKSMHRCGLMEIPTQDVPQWLSDVRRTWLTGRAPDVTDYIVPPQAVRQLRPLLRRALAGDATQDRGGGETSTYRLLLADQPELADLTLPSPEAPEWETEVPPQRLIGREPPYLAWPR